ncbi:MAG TPA: response regulator, partial [Aeromicrobium sp.]|nr:response regulator [Aeromicrobium sp.]
MNNDTETRERVLIVDDDPLMCEMLCDLLESSGLRAESVLDGASMQRALAQQGYAMLLIDLRLKREDGLMLARSVRETSDVPIIILTGQGDDTDRILGLELVADDYLTKPFNPRELVARVRAVLRRTRPGTAPRAERAAGTATSKAI